MRERDVHPVGRLEVLSRIYVISPHAASLAPIAADRIIDPLMLRLHTGSGSLEGLRRLLREDVGDGDDAIFGAISFDARQLVIARVPEASLGKLDAILEAHRDLDGLVYRTGTGDDLLRLRIAERAMARFDFAIRRHRIEFRGRVHQAPRRQVLPRPRVAFRMEQIRQALVSKGVAPSPDELERIAFSYPQPSRTEYYIRALHEIRRDRIVDLPPASPRLGEYSPDFQWGDGFSQGGGYFGRA